MACGLLSVGEVYIRHMQAARRPLTRAESSAPKLVCGMRAGFILYSTAGQTGARDASGEALASVRSGRATRVSSLDIVKKIVARLQSSLRAPRTPTRRIMTRAHTTRQSTCVRHGVRRATSRSTRAYRNPTAYAYGPSRTRCASRRPSRQSNSALAQRRHQHPLTLHSRIPRRRR